MASPALHLICVLLAIKLSLSYIDIVPQIPETLRTSYFFPEKSIVQFYPVTKKGGPTKQPLLPWHPGSGDSTKKLYFNIESEHGVLYRIKLRRNKHLFSKTVSTNLIGQDAGCLFSGIVVGDRKSTVGINLCNGMGSILSSVDGEFLLQPTDKEELHRHEWKLYMIKAPPETTRNYLEERNVTRESVESLRTRRSIKSKISRVRRNIEILVVADNEMVKKYGTEEATTYILTVMNMVSSLFKDRSLEVDVNIVLAGLMFLKGDEEGLEIGHRVDVTLNNFCQWQASLKDKIHHDHAILMTGVDICVDRNAPCDTIGYAPIRGMCSHTRSCTVNEDRGLGVAFTIAHEIGHNLGMVHDGTQNNCTDDGSIMGPSLTTDTGTFFWSKCNQRQLAEFLASDQSRCLLEDAPVKSETYNITISELPGQVYSGDQQCKHLYGHQAAVCQFDLPNGVDICRYLWCYVGGMRCETKFLPAAEGTPCDEDKWCRQGECIPVNKDTPEPIDGGWDDWSEWTECTRTCGGGVKTRHRYCTNPSPRYGGKYCAGDSKEYGRCNMEKCDGDEKQFRATQCSQYDNQPFKGRYFKWAPVDNRYLSSMDRCKLFCRAKRYNFFFQMNDKVIDGTRCDDEGHDICISGKCQPVGCDGNIWSDAEEDRCGVCNGDGTSCELIRGLFTGAVIPNNYTTFLTIPAGSTNIHIKELRSSSSFLAVKSSTEYYLNGGWSMDWAGKFHFAGSKFVYNRLYSGLEMLYSEGPTNETLEIQILAVGFNPGVQYEYMAPINTSIIRYTWRVSTSACSDQCGGGFEEIVTSCIGSDDSLAADDKCSEAERPPSGRFRCNEQPCPARWVPQTWSQCSRTCGGGKERRDVYCMQRVDSDTDRRVKNRYCSGRPKPAKARQCNTQECLPEWTSNSWSQCSVSCGQGIQTRSVYCTSTGRRKTVLSDDKCESQFKPDVSRICEMQQCSVKWIATDWGQCSVSCGPGGTQSRRLVCVSQEPGTGYNSTVDTSMCESSTRPQISLFRPCTEEHHCPSWHTGAWSQCSATCGESERRRQVSCLMQDGSSTSGCSNRDKPSEIQRCHLSDCPTTTTDRITTPSPPPSTAERACKDSKSWCPSLAIYKYYCMRSYYQTVCCQTCSSR